MEGIQSHDSYCSEAFRKEKKGPSRSYLLDKTTCAFARLTTRG